MLMKGVTPMLPPWKAHCMLSQVTSPPGYNFDVMVSILTAEQENSHFTT